MDVVRSNERRKCEIRPTDGLSQVDREERVETVWIGGEWQDGIDIGTLEGTFQMQLVQFLDGEQSRR